MVSDKINPSLVAQRVYDLDAHCAAISISLSFCPSFEAGPKGISARSV
jgi:hypothetical protein